MRKLLSAAIGAECENSHPCLTAERYQTLQERYIPSPLLVWNSNERLLPLVELAAMAAAAADGHKFRWCADPDEPMVPGPIKRPLAVGPNMPWHGTLQRKRKRNTKICKSYAFWLQPENCHVSFKILFNPLILYRGSSRSTLRKGFLVYFLCCFIRCKKR